MISLIAIVLALNPVRPHSKRSELCFGPYGFSC